MKKTFVILDEFFPYLNKEPFLESEINFYNNCNVHIFACSANNSMPKREIKKQNVRIYAQGIEGENNISSYLRALFCPDFIKELIYLIKKNKFNIFSLKQLFSFISLANEKYNWIRKELDSLGFDKDTNFVCYSYWMYYHAYVALLLKKYYKNCKVITRCHGFDLYEYRNLTDYIPLRHKILSIFDEIHPISKDGELYLKTRYPNIKMNIKVSRLGTNDYGWIKDVSERKILKIVSCSWVVQIKRLDRIISSLEKINDLTIEWTHYGDGELYEEIKQLAKQKLQNKHNITYLLQGAVSNQELIEKYYYEQYHLFINVSESEGVPVSIMEAISFGIPVIATNVGGVKEIVSDSNNGFLLDKDFTDEQLIDAINKVSNMHRSKYLKLRQNARDIWEKNYNAEKNYKQFVGNI